MYCMEINLVAFILYFLVPSHSQHDDDINMLTFYIFNLYLNETLNARLLIFVYTSYIFSWPTTVFIACLIN